MEQDRIPQLLMHLGLTFLQAKTYLALSKLGTASIKEISHISKMSKQDTYRVIPTLQALGLVEKRVTTPATYKATFVREAVTALVEKQAREFDGIREDANDLVKTLPEGKPENSEFGEEYFSVTCEREALIRKAKTMLDETRYTVDNLAPWRSFSSTLGVSVYEDILERGLKVRALTQEPRDMKLIPKDYKVLSKNPHFEYKFISAPSVIGLFLYDKKQVSLFTTYPILPETAVLWSNCRALVEIIANYFDELWKAARDPKSYQTRREPSTSRLLSSMQVT